VRLGLAQPQRAFIYSAYQENLDMALLKKKKKKQQQHLTNILVLELE
jgi:hypothetical protein